MKSTERNWNKIIIKVNEKKTSWSVFHYNPSGKCNCHIRQTKEELLNDIIKLFERKN